MYKIVAKVFSRRLKKVMPTIIDKRQTAFVEGRHMLHSVLIANEVVDEEKGQNKSCLVFKVDYKKAYESICWEFLLYMYNLELVLFDYCTTLFCCSLI